MRIWILCVGSLLLGGSLLFSGCAHARAPVPGFWYSDVHDGYVVSGNVGHAKVGEAMATSYLGLIAIGDASIKAAMDSQSITKIHHVDYYTHSIMGVIATYKIQVYGE
ncbi:MAG: hypothetical protein HY717_08110 [Planctomycetes bacterium]|nr:hypothetical protein [Planctomycetota bacterium]